MLPSKMPGKVIAALGVASDLGLRLVEKVYVSPVIAVMRPVDSLSRLDSQLKLIGSVKWQTHILGYFSSIRVVLLEYKITPCKSHALLLGKEMVPNILLLLMVSPLINKFSDEWALRQPGLFGGGLMHAFERDIWCLTLSLSFWSLAARIWATHLDYTLHHDIMPYLRSRIMKPQWPLSEASESMSPRSHLHCSSLVFVRTAIKGLTQGGYN